MAIYDNDGTAESEWGKMYDTDGTAEYQIGKLYDSDGTADSLIHNAEFILFGNGVLYGTWGELHEGGTITSSGWTAYVDNDYGCRYLNEKIDFSQYNTIEITTSQLTSVGNRNHSAFRFGVASGFGMYTPGYIKRFEYSLKDQSLAAGTYTLDISDVTDTAYFAMDFYYSGQGTVYSAKLY